jgi:hypothetical protein
MGILGPIYLNTEVAESHVILERLALLCQATGAFAKSLAESAFFTPRVLPISL